MAGPRAPGHRQAVRAGDRGQAGCRARTGHALGSQRAYRTSVLPAQLPADWHGTSIVITGQTRSEENIFNKVLARHSCTHS